MKKLAVILGVVGLIAGSAVLAWNIRYQPAVVHYKLTMVVEQEDGNTVSGSSVVMVKYQRQPQILGVAHQGTRYFRGEAVAVDLGEGKVLFALLKEGGFRSDPPWLVLRSFNIDKISDYGQTLSAIRRLSKEIGRKAKLQPEDLPMLVTFGDLNDPMSVKQVDPTDLTASFGAGTKLVDATIEITDEPVTWEIQKWLPWLQSLNGNYLHGGFTFKDSPLGLYGAEFQRGHK